MYSHKVQYYETDRMGITHHSNYIRWMEEARVWFLDSIGWSYAKLEHEGIISPVVDVSCKYKKSTTFDDVVDIDVKVKEFKSVKLVLEYTMYLHDTNEIVCKGISSHAFTERDGKIIILKKKYPSFANKLTQLADKNNYL